MKAKARKKKKVAELDEDAKIRRAIWALRVRQGWAELRAVGNGQETMIGELLTLLKRCKK